MLIVFYCTERTALPCGQIALIFFENESQGARLQIICRIYLFEFIPNDQIH